MEDVKMAGILCERLAPANMCIQSYHKITN